ncbi:unnamed protein product [Mytilus edulis]|uniref:Integrase catalytic domain-containing protein n=3 Tax=Mytilus TaxID=6548 RepID=A0A8S3PRB8_MYTED|nr:unnamed protein product [Mytilus edulis]
MKAKNIQTIKTTTKVNEWREYINSCVKKKPSAHTSSRRKNMCPESTIYIGIQTVENVDVIIAEMNNALPEETKEYLVPDLTVKQLSLSAYLPISKQMYDRFQKSSAEDFELKELTKTVIERLPLDKSELVKNFAKDYGFQHLTSSPTYAQSNGQAERTVQTIKSLLKKSKDPYKSLLDYRNTAITELELSPAQIFYGRRLKTTLPTTAPLLNVNNSQDIRRKLKERQSKQKHYYDRHSKPLEPLQNGQKVLVHDGNKWSKHATVKRKHHTPRSYVVETADGRLYRRNRKRLRPTKCNEDQHTQKIVPKVNHNHQVQKEVINTPSADETSACVTQSVVTKTRSGRNVQIPTKFNDYNHRQYIQTVSKNHGQYLQTTSKNQIILRLYIRATDNTYRLSKNNRLYFKTHSLYLQTVSKNHTQYLQTTSKNHRQYLQTVSKNHRQYLQTVSKNHRQYLQTTSKNHRQYLQTTTYKNHRQYLQTTSKNHRQYLQTVSKNHRQYLETTYKNHRQYLQTASKNHRQYLETTHKNHRQYLQTTYKNHRQYLQTVSKNHRQYLQTVSKNHRQYLQTITFDIKCIEMKKPMGAPAKRRSVSSVEIVFIRYRIKKILLRKRGVSVMRMIHIHRAFECIEVVSSILTKRTSTLTTVKIKAIRFIKTS